jgi:N-methylhydantoinase A
MPHSVGIDVGGTFTDFVVGYANSQTLTVWKTPTTRPDPSEGIFVGFEQLIEQGLVDASEIREISVGTTVALNAILERRGAVAGMLATRGFRDVLEIGRESRRVLYDLRQAKLPVLIPRNLRLEVDERHSWSGDELRPLNAADVERQSDVLASAGAESVAICFLHSYANPAHEIEAGRIVRARHPELAVCLSHEISSDYREYERWLLAGLNAYVMPIMQRYLIGLEDGLRGFSPSARLYITHSAAGLMDTKVAQRRPIQSALSGPAAGVLGAIHTADRAEIDDFITMDMGGTSCDIAIVHGGQAQMSNSADLGGYRVGLRTVAVQSISAGGGTVAWVDSGGFLRVGPESAGSDPGPAAYGRGGTTPTVTDAHLVLGHIDTSAILGASIRLDPEAAREAVDRAIAGPLHLSVDDAAAGIIAIADAAMIRAIEVVSIEQGHDPRAYAITAFGGAAPLHASRVAAELGIERVFVPRQAGVLCALGTLYALESHEATESVLRRVGDADEAALSKVLDRLGDRAREMLAEPEGEDTSVEYAVDMRYVGQTAVLEVAWPGGPGKIAAASAAFEDQYQRTFGYAIPGREPEIAAARAIVRAPRPVPGAASVPVQRPKPPRAWKAHFYEAGETTAALYEPASLAPGVEITGPAVVNTGGSTALLLQGDRGTVDDYGNLAIHVRSVAPAEESLTLSGRR